MSEQETYNDFESLCAGYVLGALSDEEKRTFERMLDNATPEQLEIYRQMVRIKDDLSLAANPMEPSDDLFDRVLEEISVSGSKSVSNMESRSENDPKSANGWIFKAAAAILLASLLGLLLYSQQLSTLIDDKEARISELQTEVEEQNQLLTLLESELERKEELLAILESREVSLILMAGLETNPDGYGKIVWDPENERALLQVANLPEPTTEQDYQLWLIKDEQDPISAGIFSFEQTATDLFYRIDRLEERPSEQTNTFAVTLEPRGGMPQPTGDMYLLGQNE
ncbi:hypothetical protein DYD21_15945 [Rhodohalobacter sp. SW132]|uniref:anti-sigma factor n=1 Tax=Rhodohalobacter sp. SW132 TaxID=2293433 RepID=UPI000E26ECEB|nr:anti-sigma factor [Rhodohalobacter sp. SW132]REL25008.1 hypothetical protein DYD21_15945 [Rhodohalobacter sp. SW132]